MSKYGFVVWQDEGVWTAHSPSVPGVYGVGATRRAAEKDLTEGITVMLDYLKEIKAQPPKAKKIAAGVAVIA
jgi:predicted RNase H-like HicB family nuclease